MCSQGFLLPRTTTYFHLETPTCSNSTLHIHKTHIHYLPEKHIEEVAMTSSISAFLLAPLLIINLVLKILIESLHFIKSDGSN